MRGKGDRNALNHDFVRILISIPDGFEKIGFQPDFRTDHRDCTFLSVILQ